MSQKEEIRKEDTKEASKPIKSQYADLVKSSQFAWFVGHLFALLSGVVFLVTFRLFSTSFTNKLSYRVCYIAVLESFGIILYQSYSKFDVAKLLHDDNFQYFVVAALLLVTPVMYSLSILPFLIFSVFHSLNYFKSVLLPLVSESLSGQKALLTKVGNSIEWFTKSYNEKLIEVSSMIEVFNLLIISLKSIIFWRNWYLLVVYTFFIKLRYMNSVHIRKIFSRLEVQIDGLVSHPSVPVQIKTSWIHVKGYIKYVGKYDLVKRAAPEKKDM